MPSPADPGYAPRARPGHARAEVRAGPAGQGIGRIDCHRVRFFRRGRPRSLGHVKRWRDIVIIDRSGSRWKPGPRQIQRAELNLNALRRMRVRVVDVETRPRFDPLSEASRVPPSAIRSEPHIQRDRASQQYQVGADAASGAAESPCAEAYQGFAFPLASRLRNATDRDPAS